MAANLESWKRDFANPWCSASTATLLLANHRHAPDAVPVDDIVDSLRWEAGEVFESIAADGIGLDEAMAAIAMAVTRRPRECLA